MNLKRGYSLIEVLVAVAIFTIIIAAPSGFLVGSLRGELRSLWTQKLLEQTSYALEYISRSLRMAQKDKKGDCISAKYNYENPSGISSIRFLNHDSLCQEFYLANGRIYERKSNDSNAENFGQPLPLTSDDLEILSLEFRIFGQSQTDDYQPRVTIFLDIKGGRGGLEELHPKISVQTTISQRNLDVPY